MKNKGLILFDIDGVIRNVSNSYRLAAKKTVLHFCGWEPSSQDIDNLKEEGIWNNDWDLSLELIKRYNNEKKNNLKAPSKDEIVKLFEKLYFGDNSTNNQREWSGFINNEELLVKKTFFEKLNKRGIKWGFVSGAEPESAKFVLEKKLKLISPPLIAMHDAPEKPNPEGFISLARKLSEEKLGEKANPIAYVGDTIADVKTILNARKKIPNQKFISLAIAPPHLHQNALKKRRIEYENNLRKAGAEYILNSVNDINYLYKDIFNDFEN